jgi:threonine aldolase
VRPFGSDNWAPAHPAVLEAVARANDGSAQHGYGDDDWTRAAAERFRSIFGEQAASFPVFNGTGANVLAVRALCRPYHGVICAESAHVNGDECGAVEAVAGIKVLAVRTADGKLDPDLVDRRLTGRGDEHRVQPRLVSITQSTELGTLYSLEELRALADHAHGHGLLLHVDGARIANAAASLGASLRETTTDAGVDVLSFGATKNGALGAEAVVFLADGMADEVLFLRKQSLQLASKMRFISAQLSAILTDDLWHANAAHANAMASRLAAAVSDVPGVQVTQAVQANAVFAILPAHATLALQEAYGFYVWDELTGEVRWMCSWDTTPEDVDAFASDIAAACAAHAASA